MTTVNLDLARTTLELIELHPEEHKQETWRCGSGQCFAGWAALAAGAEFVVPQEELLDLEKQMDAYQEELSKIRPVPKGYDDEEVWNEYYEKVDEIQTRHPIVQPGTRESSRLQRAQDVRSPNGEVMHVAAFAREALGTQYVKGAGEDNWRLADLFDANNTREQLRKYVEGLESGRLVGTEDSEW